MDGCANTASASLGDYYSLTAQSGANNNNNTYTNYYLGVNPNNGNSPTNSGGVTPSSGRATPAHFFVSLPFIKLELDSK